MSLLTEVMRHPLDPGYADAARRRTAGARTGRGHVLLAAVLSAALGLVLVTAARDAAGREPDRGRQELLDRVAERTAEVDALAASTARLRVQQEALQQRLGRAPAAAADARSADALAAAVGARAVTGPGLEVVLADADAALGEDPAAPAPGAASGRVVDRDLQLLVNGLWAAGAEAVAVDGRRLTALTAIRSAGEAVLVGYRPLVPPYEVRALGDPTALETALAASAAGSYLRALQDNYGIGVSIARRDELVLPAADTVDLRLAAVPAPGDGALPSPAVDAAQEEGP